MTLIDHLPMVSLRPGGRVSPRPGVRAAGPLPGELEEADELIADLAALIDAGLVTVRRQLGGPVRYGAAVDLGDAA